MSEAALRRMVNEKLAPFGRLTRVENRVEKGTPDYAYTLRYGKAAYARSGWLELKHIPQWPNDDGSPVVIRSLTLEQVLWIESEARAGGRAWLLLQAGQRYLLFPPLAVRDLHMRCSARGLLPFAAVDEPIFPTRGLLRCLTW